MKPILIVAAEEWRYWMRSKLALSVIALFMVILVAVAFLTAVRMQAEIAERSHHQAESEQTFLSQPDRHPHRMVHYGHYVFRAPTPLALIDPGLDSVTGKSIFLEGHRQNSATFSASSASANFSGLALLTPATIYQLLAPLLIILLGHGAVVREREARTLAPLLAQGLGGHGLIAGKALALFSFVCVLILPLAASALFTLIKGESLLAAASLVGVYILYLLVWAALTLIVSSILRKRSSVIAALAALWLLLVLVLPAIAVNVAFRAVPIAGKIETELLMLAEVRQLGDGHNEQDSAFEQLRANLLNQQGVERVEDLDVNIRGVVAQTGEEKLTEVMNRYADRRMQAELQQANLLAGHGWFTPMLAVATASRAISGTDLEHHHRFLRQAEELRYNFVQGLNKVHAEKLSYTDDINRSRDEDSSVRARTDASNWHLLDEFRFEPASASERLISAGKPALSLLVWMAILSGLLVWTGRSLKP